MPKIDLTGKRFGRLIVIGEAESIKGGQARWLCLCDCGNISTVVSHSLRCGETRSCGCYGKKYHIKHGKSEHDLYWVYKNMVKRCSYKKHPQYKLYGGRGVFVCDEWKSDFKKFFKWAVVNGWAKGLEIDRVDNNAEYSALNCRFVNHGKNMQNSRNSKKWIVDGKIYNSLSEAANFLGVCSTTIRLWCDGGKNNGKNIDHKENCFSYKKYKGIQT